jgi:hypothetical protein
MDMNIVPATFVRDVLSRVNFDIQNDKTNKKEGVLKNEKPIEVLFEGADTNRTSIGFSFFRTPSFLFVLSFCISKFTLDSTSLTKVAGTIFISILFIPSIQAGGHTVISKPAVTPILYLPIGLNSFGITI